MRYAYEDLSDEQFETLVVALCQFLLGAGVQRFAAGPDGGRDAKFVGKADLLPSKASPWCGTVIVQAKHTNGYIKAFSDSDFFSETSDNTVLADELPRISKLRGERALDHYLLFSNRRLSGIAEPKIRAHISVTCGVPEPSIMLCGVEQLDLWLKRFPQAAEIAGIDPIDGPLLVSSDDLAEVVEHLAARLPGAGTALGIPPAPRVPYALKNTLNNMSAEYARELRRRYLKETAQIDSFLADPSNSAILVRYESAVEEFQLNIIAKRRDFVAFDEVMVYLAKLLFGRDPTLRANKRLTWAMLFYMYWHCDLGVTDAAQT